MKKRNLIVFTSAAITLLATIVTSSLSIGGGMNHLFANNVTDVSQNTILLDVNHKPTFTDDATEVHTYTQTNAAGNKIQLSIKGFTPYGAGFGIAHQYKVCIYNPWIDEDPYLNRVSGISGVTITLDDDSVMDWGVDYTNLNIATTKSDINENSFSDGEFINTSGQKLEIPAGFTYFKIGNYSDAATSKVKSIEINYSCVATDLFELDNGIRYKLNDTSDSYKVVGVYGKQEPVEIPTTYKGLPVTTLEVPTNYEICRNYILPSSITKVVGVSTNKYSPGPVNVTLFVKADQMPVLENVFGEVCLGYKEILNYQDGTYIIGKARYQATRENPIFSQLYSFANPVAALLSYNNYNVTSITLPKMVAGTYSLEEVIYNSFDGFSYETSPLEVITVPQVSYIANRAFNCLYNLKKICLDGRTTYADQKILNECGTTIIEVEGTEADTASWHPKWNYDAKYINEGEGKVVVNYLS